MSTFEIKMPKPGESITEGTIISWSVKVGDIVKEDDILFEVNTAKVSVEVPSPVEGKVSEIRFKEGDTVPVGEVVAIIETEDENSEDRSQGSDSGSDTPEETKKEEPKHEEKQASPTNVSDASTAKPSKKEDDRWYSPVVMEKAREAKIDQSELDSIPGTGYSGRLSKKDIELYIDNKKKGTTTPVNEPKVEKVDQKPVEKTQQTKTESASIPVSEEDTVIPMDPVRRIIADRMIASKKISAHVTNFIEADVTKLVRWREKNKDEFKRREGIGLTYMPAIAEATAKALIDYPRINSSVDGYNIIQKKHINIGIAVSLNDGNLIVPVIKDADKLNIAGLAGSIATMAEKGRNNKLTPDDIQGGTFTITNFGSFKSIFGTPIINQPEVAILGVGIIEKKPAVIETEEGDVIAVRHKMYLSISYDHRIIDGALAGNFLYAVAQYLENWEK